MSKQNFEIHQQLKAQQNDSTDPRQLDFSDLQFHLPQADFSYSPAYDLSKLNFSKRLFYQKTSKRYFGYSFVLHTIMATAVLFLSVPLIKEEKKEIITLEIQGLSGNEAAQPVNLPVKPAQSPSSENPKEDMIAATKSVAPVAEKSSTKEMPVAAPSVATVATAPEAESADSEPVIKLKPIVATKVPQIKVAPKAKSVQKSHGTPAKSAPAKMLAEESNVVVPESLDDIPSPHLEEAAVPSMRDKQTEDNLNKDVETDFSKVDQQPDALVEKESQKLGVIAENIESETQENLKAIEDQNQAEKEALEKATARRRQQEAQAIAMAQAQEKAESQALQQARAQAAAERAAQAAAVQAAAQAAADAAAEAQQQAGNGNGQGDGEAQQTGGSPGVGEIRSLQDMRQMPGNPKPSYDYSERLRGDAGEVVFLAYVTKDGATTRFKLSKSTGHRNLDLKTLKALKKWKFYPGQEGWVEFPFRWDLQGGAQEMPALLRRGR